MVRHTPESMTKLMCERLGFNLEQYDDYSNAYLATMDGFIKGPIWVMDCHDGHTTYYAIFKEIAQEAGQPRMLYIYQGGAHPQAVIDVGQRWQKKVKRHGKIVSQEGRVYTNKKGEIYLKRRTIEE